MSQVTKREFFNTQTSSLPCSRRLPLAQGPMPSTLCFCTHFTSCHCPTTHSATLDSLLSLKVPGMLLSPASVLLFPLPGMFFLQRAPWLRLHPIRPSLTTVSSVHPRIFSPLTLNIFPTVLTTT